MPECNPSAICAICDQKGLALLPLRYAVAQSLRRPPLFAHGEVGGVALRDDPGRHSCRCCVVGLQRCGLN